MNHNRANGQDEESERLFCENLGYYVFGNSDDWLTPSQISRIEYLRFSWKNALCESPIEWRLFACLIFCRDSTGMYEPDVPDVQWRHAGTFLDPQAEIGKYRADFLITVKNGDTKEIVVVECDGHDFHDRTKEQAARDKKRDRDLVAMGAPVLRFTGSEIVKDPWGCCFQIMKIVNGIREKIGPKPSIPGAV